MYLLKHATAEQIAYFLQIPRVDADTLYHNFNKYERNRGQGYSNNVIFLRCVGNFLGGVLRVRNHIVDGKETLLYWCVRGRLPAKRVILNTVLCWRNEIYLGSAHEVRQRYPNIPEGSRVFETEKGLRQWKF